MNQFLCYILAIGIAIGNVSCSAAIITKAQTGATLKTSKLSQKKIPVILDTDIGTDMDDTWALAMLLKSPELDIKLITTASDNTPERAKIVAKMLTIAGRTDIPIGIGEKQNDNSLQQSPWVKDYDLSSYPGVVHTYGIDALIKAVMLSKEPVTIICIGPLTNIANALTLEPEIAEHAKFVGMQGSVYRGYDNAKDASKEYNIIRDIPAAKKVFTAKWKDMVITPLDTCGIVRLQGGKYQAVCNSKDSIAKAVIDNYKIWLNGKPEMQSSILYDTVAVYLAFADNYLKMTRQGIRVTDDGYTAPDNNFRQVNCALEWENLLAFEDILVQRVCTPTHSKNQNAVHVSQ